MKTVTENVASGMDRAVGGARPARELDRKHRMPMHRKLPPPSPAAINCFYLGRPSWMRGGDFGCCGTSRLMSGGAMSPSPGGWTRRAES